MRIDVLTERLADTTANFNFVHNRNLELEKNCTQLTATVGSLQEEIAGYEAKMVGINEEKTESEKILAELRGELRRVTDELEQLACLVETERFEMEKSEFLKDFKRKQGLKRRKKKGFWAWLFGFESEEKVDDSAEGEQERLRAAQELARSTLLHALQTERASVEELEASLITLQRNNSAIMDVVQSRNSLINELNDRVAVFEEDKVRHINFLSRSHIIKSCTTTGSLHFALDGIESSSTSATKRNSRGGAKIRESTRRRKATEGTT
jgi:chromosome segregation ATPase